ncbi:MAG: hypothetical protein KAT65_02535 [Methanophagales archaeon]|nr:hypothetical protein [Methanophagales archaeon]
MKDEHLKEFSEIFEEELCEEGQRLWNAVDYRKPNSYNGYRKHLLECKHCQKELELTKGDLEDIKSDIERTEKNYES